MEAMMASDDIAVKILIEIRDEIRATNRRVDDTNSRLDGLNQRIDVTNQRLDTGLAVLRNELGTRIVESEMRTGTAIIDMHGTLKDVHVLLRDRFDLRDRVERCERDIEELKRRPVPA
jgi:hypothetical protein